MFEHKAQKFTTEDAVNIARKHYGLEATAQPLPSYLDQNFRIDSSRGRFVLKIANAAIEDAYVEFQQDILNYLANHGLSGVPSIVQIQSATNALRISDLNGTHHCVWMVTWLHGRVLANVNPVTCSLLANLGQYIGRLNKIMWSYSHPQAHRDSIWDLRQAGQLGRYLSYIPGEQRRSLIRKTLEDYEARVLPCLNGLPQSVIHHDANDYNVLVTGKGYESRISGLIDFGDALYTSTVCELAIAATYVMMGRPDPVGAAAHLVRGYHRSRPLKEAEIAVLYDLIRARLCCSLLLSAYQTTLEPNNDYLRVSEEGGWNLLYQMEETSPKLAEYRWREACGIEICPHTTSVVAWLEDKSDSFAPVMMPDVRLHQPTVLDLSVAGPWTALPGEPVDPWSASGAWFRRIRRLGAHIGIGRYNEARLVYTTDQYRTPNNDFEETRTVHLGIDLFKEAGSNVYAPLDGVVKSSTFSEKTQGYGGLIILQHNADGIPFFTLYGHLSLDSVQKLTAGTPVAKGEPVGQLGTPDENGGWIPHLHFQVIIDDLGWTDTFPGVAAASQCAVWLAVCPDPNTILGIPEDCFPPPEPASKDILTRRHHYIGRNLSISYRTPLHIVRGYRQYLYDDTGRPFLDAVNNVPHVGHSHRAVVAAAHRQMHVLNTNTRYLHRSLVEYAKRLADTMPDPLSVCFFVNSGSEANDLALRLAYTHTRRRHLVVLDGAYHGHLSGLISISPYKFDGPGGEGAPSNVHVAPMPDVYRGLHRGLDAATLYATDVDRILDEHSDKIAAFISESLLGCGGQIEFPQGYLHSVYSSVRAAGGLCIADEVQVGFGRVGTHFWGFETQNVIPDIVVLGKPMGNGHPLAGVVTTPQIAASFDNGMEFFSTFGGNPVSTTVGLAVLNVLQEERLQENALVTGIWLKEALNHMRTDHPIIGDVRGRGLFIGIELVLDLNTRAPAAKEATYIANRMAELGVLISTDGPAHNVLKIKPPLVFTQANAKVLVSKLRKVLKEDYVRL